ncbi:hypothetical protein SAMN02745163_02327 [Clostridium cavendishii DSM 21758]|uniref:Uncharacterized protein n=1 Tax=Clostridium cavendishii DSM 21758 TaxID=1121302 RepID=A0A1M6KXM7_9CLOT|nr:hypothetical protein [Clostridium cavendishii]SHJ63685.1 hypothetical protein SAMN02745163_02327 [Clostridium cavendishii DSM 21758]
MSLDCNSFYYENGTTGFLGGIISCASDEFNIQMYNSGVRYVSFDADIFYIGENNEITFENSIKNRMKSFWYGAASPGDTTDIDKLIDSSHFKLKKSHETKLSDIITKMCSGINGVDLEKLIIEAKEFETSIQYYLYKPITIYNLPYEDNKSIYECNSIISRCYTYTIFDIVLVEYDEYIILLVIGSDE